MTIGTALEMIARGETPEQYASRINKIRRYARERDDLEDALSVLTDPADAEKREKKLKRLAVVNEKISQLS